MRVIEVIAIGIAITVFFIVFPAVYGIIVGVLATIGVYVPSMFSDFISYVGGIAGAGFVAFVVFDYVYDIIVGEEEG